MQQDVLSERELLVARALSNGDTIGSLAIKLHRSEATIRTQRTAIYAKLRVSNRAQLIQCLMASGLCFVADHSPR